MMFVVTPILGGGKPRDGAIGTTFRVVLDASLEVRSAVVFASLIVILVFLQSWRALLVPAVFFGINMIEGNLITPMIHGSRMRLNTVAVFIGLIFWWFLWGIPGAILAVPMMAAIKIVCDHIESLAPIGEFLGK